jgi:hypothetical protein
MDKSDKAKDQMGREVIISPSLASALFLLPQTALLDMTQG